jgi:hypothetical protein
MWLSGARCVVGSLVLGQERPLMRNRKTDIKRIVARTRPECRTFVARGRGHYTSILESSVLFGIRPNKWGHRRRGGCSIEILGRLSLFPVSLQDRPLAVPDSEQILPSSSPIPAQIFLSIMSDTDGDTVDLHSGGTRFESLLVLQLFWAFLFVVFFNPSQKMLD